MPVAERIEGSIVVLRRARPDDAPVVSAVVNSPGVVEWWTHDDVDERRADLAIDDGSYVAYLIEVDGEVVGLVQYSQEADPQYRHAGIDIAVRREHHRRGIGRDAIVALAAHLIDDLGHHRLVIDPAAANTAAIACYTAVGFVPVGVMRRYERGADGTFHDGLLMDLLADELIR